ncbi:hypothetical protein DSO57_1003441 [Entomophthora muscae]|uniref:Uncharacterized protein n=1 Tax=Entomophthora muscae TaxID=34485 RepID=A0ACC2UHX5_9FUNG|nr:hypothetical protein DSO57_1003441 [Entomophthora muscae]
MIDSNLIWIGCQDEACLGNLSVAFPSLKSAAPGSMLLGNPIEDEFSLTLATRLGRLYDFFYLTCYFSQKVQPTILDLSKIGDRGPRVSTQYRG